MSRYWKLWLAVGGNVVAIAVVALGMTTGIATCEGTPSAETCTLFGYSPLAIYATLNTILAPLLVANGPANSA